MSLLARILDAKRVAVKALRNARFPAPPGSTRDLGLTRAGGQRLRLIAEHKRRSPSAGPLSTALSVEDRARAYAAGGASVLSVLTDRDFFEGSFDDLAKARGATDLPLLCKDFVIDEVQLDAARAYGADAALLIVRCLDPARLSRLTFAARERGLTPIVEVTSEAELVQALDAGADHVGVNARDLDTLELDPTRAARVLARVAEAERAVPLHFSGLRTPRDVAEVSRGVAHGALIGEALMRVDDPTPLLLELVAAT